MSQMLLSTDATVTTCHSKTENIEQYLRNADIVPGLGWFQWYGSSLWPQFCWSLQSVWVVPKTQVVAAIGQAEFVRACLSSYRATELIPIFHWGMFDSCPARMYIVLHI